MLYLTPITLIEANEFVAMYHRNHKPVVGHKFSIAVSDSEKIRGVVIVGRPVSRHLDDGWTLEVTRNCTDGASNAASCLYGAAWRAAKAMGYKKLVTYTLPSEGGASLRASGWRCIGRAGGGNWNVKSRPRIDTEHQQQKLRWEQSENVDQKTDQTGLNSPNSDHSANAKSLKRLAEREGFEPS